MGLQLSVTLDKTSINLGETVTATYSCTGAYDCLLQADNMPNPIEFGTGEVSGNIKLLPVTSGDFNVTITSLGVVHQRKGLDLLSEIETNTATATVTVR